MEDEKNYVRMAKNFMAPSYGEVDSGKKFEPLSAAYIPSPLKTNFVTEAKL